MENTEKLLVEAANSIGICLSKEQKEAFLLYLRILQDQSKITNIVANSEAEEIIRRHFIDSIAIPPILHRLFTEQKQIRLLDIGTGGGFPGVPLKIMYPAINLNLIEATNKKVDFVKEVIQKLALSTVSIVWGRAEEFGHEGQYRGKYDVVVARALAELNVLLELSLPFIKEQGIFVAYKGPKYQEEIARAKKALLVLGGEVQDLIEMDRAGNKRAFVIIQKVSDTPAKYPRRPGIPQKRPIL